MDDQRRVTLAAAVIDAAHTSNMAQISRKRLRACVSIRHSCVICILCFRGVDPLPKLGVFKCVRLPDTQSQKRHHNVTSQNDVTRTEQNRLGM